MIVGTVTTIGTALLGAALFTKVGQKLMLGDINAEWLADELEFDMLHPDGVTVSLKTGEYFRVFKLKGLAFETMAAQQESVLATRRSNFIHQNFSDGVNFRLFGIKRQKDVSFDAEWPSPILKEIGEAEKELYRNAYSIHWYMVISSTTDASLYEASRALLASFTDYECEAITATSLEDSNAGVPCELTSFINYLVCGDLRDDLPRISNNISAALPASDISFERKTGLIITQTPGAFYSKIMNIRSWPESVSGILISKILALPAEIEICHICNPLNSERTIAFYKRKQNEQRSNFFGSAAVLGELETALSHLINNTMTLMETQFQITVRAKSEEELEKVLDDVYIILNQARVSASVESTGGAVCWFNRLPERTKLLRPLRLFNDDIAAMWPFQYSPEGLYSSPFGDKPIRLFKTPTSQIYSMQFHVNPQPQSAGNYLVLAPTGTGKSTLIMHLLGGIAKFPGIPNYVFDSKNGAQYMIESMGGIYQGYEDLALNPLDTDLSTMAGMHRARMVLRAMCGDIYTPEIDEELHQILEMAAYLQPPERTFNNIFASAFEAKSELKRSFAKWVEDVEGMTGQYAHIFNSPEDKIKTFLEGSHLVGVNMNEALEDKILGPAVVTHISAAISEAAKRNQRGFTIFVDEAANLLQNAGFRQVVLEMFREYRKLNGLVGLAFQDPEALLKCEGAEGIIKNTQTLFFMPNSQATAESLEPFNLTSDQIGFIRGESQLAKGRQVLVVKRDIAQGYNESAIIDVDLTGLGDALRFYRAGTTANSDLEKLKTQYPEDWQTRL